MSTKKLHTQASHSERRGCSEVGRVQGGSFFLRHPERSESASGVEGPRAVLRAPRHASAKSPREALRAGGVDPIRSHNSIMVDYARRAARDLSTPAISAQDD